jgi:quercetin dioxygenase-like cupin family protein
MTPHSFSQDNDSNQRLKYSVLYTDSEGLTHFKDQYLSWNDSGDGFSSTPLVDAKQIGFFLIQAGKNFDWHPTPRKQFVMVLDGTMEVEAGDGEKRKSEPGNILLVTDIKGRGHRTNNLGNKPITIVWVPLP